MISLINRPIPVTTPLGDGYIFYITPSGFLENDEITVILEDGGEIKHFSSDQVKVWKNATYKINEKLRDNNMGRGQDCSPRQNQGEKPGVSQEQVSERLFQARQTNGFRKQMVIIPMGHTRDNNQMKNSDILDSVIEDLVKREERGLGKYGTTVDRTDLSEKEWLQHAYEEALDFAVHLKKLISTKNG